MNNVYKIRINVFFENEDWNGKIEDSDLLTLEFTAIFDRYHSQPKMKKVVFQGCTYGSYNGWSLDGTVCGNED